MDLLTVASLSAGAVKVLTQVLKERFSDKSRAKITIKVGGDEFNVANADELTPEMLASLAQLLASSEKPPDNPLSLSMKSRQDLPQGTLRSSGDRKSTRL